MPLDFGIGVVWSSAKGWIQLDPETERSRAAFSVVGPYLEAAYYPLRYDFGDDLWLRAGARASVDWLFQSNAPEHRGVGGFLGGQVEFVRGVQGLFADVNHDSAVVGYARGGVGVGLFGGGQLVKLADAQVVSVVAGMSFRVPFMAGIACCLGISGKDPTSSRPAQPRQNYVVAKPTRKAPER
jgi:hypothetical protein